MDWMSAFTKNIFIEEKTLHNTKAQKMAIGLLYVHTFDVEKLRELYEARKAGIYLYKHVVGGDQADNRGMLLPREITKTEGQPFWLATRELTQQR
jgi:hypothetical protein